MVIESKLYLFLIFTRNEIMFNSPESDEDGNQIKVGYFDAQNQF